MMKIINVLIFPAGEMNSAELQEALSRTINVRIFGAASVERHGRHLFRSYRNDLPFIDSPEFIGSFNALLESWEIDLVIPTHDSVVDYLSDHRAELHSTVLLPDVATAKICRSKSLTYEIFAGCDFVPVVHRDPPAEGTRVFVKPDKGQGGVGARALKYSSVGAASIDWNTEVVTEYLPGAEVTVDCLTDAEGALLGVYPRSRDRVLGGISVSGLAITASDEVKAIAAAINDRLGFLGLWYFQLKARADGTYILLEISARCSGGQAITRARGVNLPVLSTYIATGRSVVVPSSDYPVKVDRVFRNMTVYEFDYETVYLDYDDCLINENYVNPDIISFVYRARNDGKRIILITKHDGDLKKSLASHSIDPKLFDEIIHLDASGNKADYMSPIGAIFIDNSFTERESAHRVLGLPVFDVEGVDMLQSWKR